MAGIRDNHLARRTNAVTWLVGNVTSVPAPGFSTTPFRTALYRRQSDVPSKYRQFLYCLDSNCCVLQKARLSLNFGKTALFCCSDAIVATAWGARGRGFKSRRPDSNNPSLISMVGCFFMSTPFQRSRRDFIPGCLPGVRAGRSWVQILLRAAKATTVRILSYSKPAVVIEDLAPVN